MGEPTTTLNQEAANRTASGPATQAAAPAKPAITPTADSGEGRKLVRNLVALLVVFSAVFLTLYVWSVLERHPRTDDATARANVVGIAPRVAGQILKLNVQDNQAVKEGDVLFEIDPEDYNSCWKRPKLIWPHWIDRLHKPIAPCGAWNRSYLKSLPPPKAWMKPEPN